MKLRKFKDQILSRFRIVWMLSLSIMAVSLTSCLDDDDGVVVPDVSVAYVSLYHASPDAPPLDVLADNNLIFYNPIEYSEYTGYLRFYTGERELKFSPYNANNTLVDTTVTLEESALYSIFVIGEEDDLQTLILEDDIPDTTDENSAVVRIVNLSPDGPSVDISNEEGVVFEDIAYKKASDFIEIPAGSTTFDLTATGESEVITSVADYDFKEGFVYTIIVRGYENPPSGNNNGLSVQVTRNFLNY